MKRIWSFLIANFDTVIAIIVSIVAAVYGIFNVNQRPLLAGIAATLGILAFGLIRDRLNRENLTSHISTLEHIVSELLTGKVSSDNFFYKRDNVPELSSRFKKVKNSLDIMGTSLFTIGVTYQAILRELKGNGVKIRLLLSNPDNSSLQEFISMRCLEMETARVHVSQVRASLASLSQIIGVSASGGSIELHMTDNIQTFGFVGTDVAKPDGEIQIEFYLNKTGLTRDPIFLLNRMRDTQWFTEFQNQFEFFWEHAIDVDPKKYVQSTDK